MSQLLPISSTHAIIDDKDYFRASKHVWWYDSAPIANIDGKKTSLARYILCVSGSTKVFNKNGDKMDCRRSNLTSKRSECEFLLSEKALQGLLRSEMSRHMRIVVGMENYTGETPKSRKMRDRIGRAELILKVGDKKELLEILKIMRRVK
jgi:hypothetical protein